jgi:hypothetical protein
MKILLFAHRVQTSCGTDPVSYPMGTEGKVDGGVKLTTRLHLMPRLRMRGAIPPFPPQNVFTGWYLVKYREKFTFTLHFTQYCT